MKQTETRCVGCELPCLGSACPNSGEVIIYTCEKCKKDYEKDEMFKYDDKEYCEGCLLKQLKNDGIIEVVE